MPRFFPPVIMLTFVLGLACSKVDRAYPEAEEAEAIVFGKSLTRSEYNTTDSTLLKEGFLVHGTSSDGSSAFCEKAVWDSVGFCFRTENADYYYPSGNGVRMDFIAVYPASTGISSNFQTNSVPACSEDIVAAVKRDVEKQKDPVLLEFRHILSKVKISLSPLAEDAQYIIDSLLVSTPASGCFSFNDFNWKDFSAPTRVACNEEQFLTVFPGRISVTVRWKTVRNGFVTAEYCRSADFVTQMGQCSLISLFLSDYASSKCEFKVTVLPWDDIDVETKFN